MAVGTTRVGSAGLVRSGLVTWKVEIALESTEAGSIWGTGTWQDNGGGDGIWSGIQPSWIDVTDLCLGADWNRGRDRWDQRARTGSGTFDFDNTDGQFNPTFGESLPGQLSLRPGRFIRISGEAGAGFIPQFTGVIDDIDDRYRDGAWDITTRVHAVDAFGKWARWNPPALASVVPAERTDQRIDRILDLVTFPDVWRSLEVGIHSVQSSDLPRAYLDEMGITSDSEGGLFFMDGNSFAVLQNLDYRATADRAINNQFSVGNGDTDDLKLLGADSDWSLQRIQNDIRLARSGGSEQRVQNSTSQSLYGLRTFRRSDYENVSDVEVLTLAENRLDQNQWDAIRIDEIRVEATTRESAQLLLTSELTDRIRVVILPRAGEWGYAQDVHLTRIRGNVNSQDFTFVFRVDDASTSAPGDVGSFSSGYDDGYLIGGA